MAPRSPLHQISVFYSTTQNQTGPLWCWFLSGWACAHSRPLWVSPMTSPVRLGVSPAAAPTPTGIFNQRFEALFPCAGALAYAVCFTPRRSSRFICAQMWGCRVCQWSDCLPRLSHTPPVSVPPWPRESSPSLCPSPPLLPVWTYVSFLSPWCRTSLPFNFLSALVVRGGAVCLPMPPSWFSYHFPFIPGSAHPLLCQFCAMLNEMQPSRSTFSFLVVF